jgi:hypothetical protein
MRHFRFALLLCVCVLTPLLVEARGSIQGNTEEQLATRAYFKLQFREALPHFLAAANAGNSEAYSFLGHMYEWGYGVPQDRAQAAIWFRKSVAAGNLIDQLMLTNAPTTELANSYQPHTVQPPVAQRPAAPETSQLLPEQAQQQGEQQETDRQQRIEQLKSDIEVQEHQVEVSEQGAQDLANSNNNNCNSGGFGSLLCRGIGTAGIAKFKKEAAKARNQIAADQEELERLRGQEVQHRARQDDSFGTAFQQAAANGSAAPPQSFSSYSSSTSASGKPEETYDPNRHYSGPNADQVSTLLSRSFGWSCPTSSTASVSWQPPQKQVCMRDSYIIGAVSLAYGAECEARLGRTKEARDDADAMAQNITYAKQLCSKAPVFGPGPECSTIRIVPCP